MKPTLIADCKRLPVFDSQAFVRDLGGDINAAREVAAFFVEDSMAVQDELQRSCDQPVSALLPVIHEIANSMGVVGCLRGLCVVRGLEERARAGAAISAAEIVAQTHTELVACLGEIRDWLEDGT